MVSALTVRIYKASAIKKTTQPNQPSSSVTRPLPHSIPGTVGTNKRVRSTAALAKKEGDNDLYRLQQFMRLAPKITVPVTLEELQKTSKNLPDLENICQTTLGPSQPARCTSAQYVDRDGKPILFYLAKRLVYPKEEVPVCLLSLVITISVNHFHCFHIALGPLAGISAV